MSHTRFSCIFYYLSFNPHLNKSINIHCLSIHHLYPFIPVFIHPSINPSIHPSIHSCTSLPIHMFTSPINLLIQLCTNISTHHLTIIHLPPTTSTHPSIHPCIHLSIPAYFRTYIPPHISIYSCIHHHPLSIYAFMHPSINSSAYSSTHPQSVHSPTHSYIIYVSIYPHICCGVIILYTVNMC